MIKETSSGWLVDGINDRFDNIAKFPNRNAATAAAIAQIKYGFTFNYKGERFIVVSKVPDTDSWICKRDGQTKYFTEQEIIGI